MFSLSGAQLFLDTAASFEDGAQLQVIIRTTDLDGQSIDRTLLVDVTDINEAPTDILLNNLTVVETVAGANIGTVSAVDPDTSTANDFAQHVFSVDDPRFEIVGGVLKLRDGLSLDFETEQFVSVSVTATDRNGSGLSFSKIFTLEVSDVIEQILGTEFDDVLNGTIGADEIFGFGGNDTLNGLSLIHI